MKSPHNPVKLAQFTHAVCEQGGLGLHGHRRRGHLCAVDNGPTSPAKRSTLMTPLDLFDDLTPTAPVAPTQLAPGAVLLHGFCRESEMILLQAIEAVLALAPLRHLQTPGGYTMSVAMSNCGALGWVSDPSGYRYSARDPHTQQPWPAMPGCFLDLARRAAAQAGYADFGPSACLINEYRPGAKLSLHQDKDELDLNAPIVSFSLGLPAVFLFGTAQRSQRAQRYRLIHGDVVVWGGPSRLAYHGVAPLGDGDHRLLGRRRLNLTFRCAG